MESSHDIMAAKIYELPIRGDGVYTVDKKPGETTNKATLIKTARHVFYKILPQHGYAVRENQIELAEHILDVTNRRGILLAESEVGTGKTHAYLVAAVLAKRGRMNDYWLRGHYPQQSWADSAYMPIVISTSSIALQQAIVKDYIPELSQILLKFGVIRSPLTAVIRKGKEHYICEKRLRAYHYSADPQTKKLLHQFIGVDTQFDLTNVDILTPYMKQRICVSDKCGDNCKHRNKCRYLNYMKTANDSKVDFQITNHNYFLADTLHRTGEKRPLIPNYQFVIIDEAHKFLQAARQMYGLKLTDTELPALAHAIHTFTIGKSKSGVNVHRIAKKMAEQSEKLFLQLNANIINLDTDDDTERFTTVIDYNVRLYLNNIFKSIETLEIAIADSRVHKINEERRTKTIRQLRNIGDKVKAFLKQSKLIYWLEKQAKDKKIDDALCAIRKDLDEWLYEDLWNNDIPIILTSGTLSASGDFTRTKQTLGLNRLSERKLFEITMSSPFDYRNNKLLYISENVPFPDISDKQYIIAVANEIEQLVIASNGHAAVLFTSYKVMGQVHAILKQRKLQFPLFRLERGGTHAIERFKQSGNGILLASGALWEGIDIPGDTLSMLIIVKLPFTVPNPINDYEQSLCGDKETFKSQVVVPDMQIKLKQGDGRLIRSETDTGVCAILDIRASERGSYRKKVLSALPKCNVTSDIKVVQNFFISKKPAAYFNNHNQLT